MESKHFAECDRCNNDFSKADLQGFKGADYCAECFEIEHVLNWLKPFGNYFMLNLDKHVVRNIQPLPLEFDANGIKKNAIQFPNYTAKEISEILHEYKDTIDTQTSDLFNSNFTIINLER